MTREELDCLLKQHKEGGTKRACIIIRDFLKYAMPIGSNTIRMPPDCSYVHPDEFLQAVCTLLTAATLQDEDIVPPERWCCESDCVRSADPLCKWKFNTDFKSTKTCPYYAEEDK